MSQSFLELLTAKSSNTLFNPWQDCSSDDVTPKAATDRRARLLEHLSLAEPALLCIGEAPGHLGCRASGIAFTSERLLLECAIPRVSPVIGRLTSNPRPLSEPSATIMWNAFTNYGVAEHVVLFNAVPYHPHEPGRPFTNRTPTAAERRDGEEILAALLALFPGTVVAAVGQIAARSIERITGSPPPTLRHPSFGGAPQFRRELRDLLNAHGLLNEHPQLF